MLTVETVTACLALIRGSGKHVELLRDTTSAAGLPVPGTVAVWQKLMAHAIPEATQTNWLEATTTVCSGPDIRFVDVSHIITACQQLRAKRISEAPHWTVELPSDLTVSEEADYRRYYSNLVAGGECGNPFTEARELLQAQTGRTYELPAPEIIVSDSLLTDFEGELATLGRVEPRKPVRNENESVKKTETVTPKKTTQQTTQTNDQNNTNNK